jgi:carotenoid cleavage dioxygenase
VFARGEPTTDANLHVFDKDGRLIREEWFHTPYPGLSHDWGVTREHLVFPIMPLLADDSACARATSTTSTTRPAVGLGDHAAQRLGRRCAGSDPGMVMGHVMNAYTEGTGSSSTPRQPGNCFCFFKDKHGNLPTMPETITQITRIVFDLSKPDAEAVTLHPVQGAYGDMPKIDDRFAMEKYRHGYFAFRDFPRMGVAQIDWDTRSSSSTTSTTPPRRNRCSSRAAPTPRRRRLHPHRGRPLHRQAHRLADPRRQTTSRVPPIATDQAAVRAADGVPRELDG